MINFNILTLFPEIFPGPLNSSIAGKALEKHLYSLNITNIRDFAFDKHKTVDDKIFGGSPGMLLKPDVVGAAIESSLYNNPKQKLIYFSPRGKKFNQQLANHYAQENNLLLLCGRYEGVDQRIFDKYDFDEISIGDYILSGGEFAALVFIDALLRLIPGVIDNEMVNKEESFSIDQKNLLEYDQYTRPAMWKGLEVPEVLISGNHQKILKWQKENAVSNTLKRRPDLINT